MKEVADEYVAPPLSDEKKHAPKLLSVGAQSAPSREFRVDHRPASKTMGTRITANMGDKARYMTMAGTPRKTMVKESSARTMKKGKAPRSSIVTKAYETIAVNPQSQRKSLFITRDKAGSLIPHTPSVPSQMAANGEMEKYPLTLAVAVAIDALLDGTYIGIGFAAAGTLQGGLLLCISLAIEMTFLGLTFAVAIPESVSTPVRVASLLMGPAVLMSGSFLGAGVGLALKSYDTAFKAVTAFGASALLFTVGEELLIAAHEESEEHEWWIDINLIIGFLVTLIINKLIN